MCRKTVWCYVIVLTLLDISLNIKLTAQGKSHDVTVPESSVEGVTFQDWGEQSAGGGDGDGDGDGGGATRDTRDALRLSPAALTFGRRSLCAAHALTVTVYNAHNATVHLASLAGTTPDFHASFFESKTLRPQTGTTFSVVYVGRREGPVAAHIYLHTSLGLYKYPVSAVGVGSEYEVWPLVGVRVPAAASVEPVLTMYNPTDATIQVTEVYSSGAWMGLRLPDGGSTAPRRLWAVPPREYRDLVRLRLRPPASHPQTHHHHQHYLTAYIRIKANVTGGGLVVGVEARAAPPGEHARPLQLRLRTRHHTDPPLALDIEVGNSLGAALPLEGAVWGARCVAPPAAPPAPPAPPADPRDPHDRHVRNGRADKLTNGDSDNGAGAGGGGGGGGDGVRLSLQRTHLEPHQQPEKVARLTLDFEKMWASRVSDNEEGTMCAGWVRVGRAMLPYSVRILPGTLRLRLDPDNQFVTSLRQQALRERTLVARNELPLPLRVDDVTLPPDARPHFEMVWSARRSVVAAGAATAVARVRLRHIPAAPRHLTAELRVRTNLTDYTLPLLLYTGALQIEFEWETWRGGGGGGGDGGDGGDGDGDGGSTLEAGAVSAGGAGVSVPLVLRNPGGGALCVRALRLLLPPAAASSTVALHACAALPDDRCACVPGGGSIRGAVRLRVDAGAGTGALAGTLRVDTQHAHTTVEVRLAAHAGELRARPLRLRTAPYAGGRGPLVVDNGMALAMRVRGVRLTRPSHLRHAVSFTKYKTGEGEGEGGEIGASETGVEVGEVAVETEVLCAPHCYTGLSPDTPDGAGWAARCGTWSPPSLEADARLVRERHARYLRQPRDHNLTLLLHTDQVMQVTVTGTLETEWPRLVVGEEPGWAGPVGVGERGTTRVRVRNPSRSHALLLHASLAPDDAAPHRLQLPAETERAAAACGDGRCADARGAFSLGGWRAVRGSVRPSPRAQGAPLPPLLLAPAAELDLDVEFRPARDALLAAHLYLRNNLTVIEALQLAGRGAEPRLVLGGRPPGRGAPLLFEVGECGGPGGEAGVVRLSVAARNEGAAPLRVREVRLAGRPCAARGFAARPCRPLTIAPNRTQPLHLAYAPDYTLARVACPLHLHTDLGVLEFHLAAVTSARVLARCGGARSRPPWDGFARGCGALVALAALALSLAAGALDAERLLRRARHHRHRHAPRAPLDLRALAADPTPDPAGGAGGAGDAPPAPRRRKPARRAPPPPPPDPAAERRAFERWHARLARRSSPPPPPDGADADCEGDEEGSGGDASSRSRSSEGPAGGRGETLSPPDDEDSPDSNGSEGELEGRRRTTSSTDEAATASSGSDCERREEEPPPALAAAAAAPPARVAAPPTAARPPHPPRPPRPARPPPPRADPEPVRRDPPRPKHSRKEKVSKRRERSGGGSGAAGGGVRWGASWSSVVAARSPDSPCPAASPSPTPRPSPSSCPSPSPSAAAAAAPLAPIGSDVRRRPAPPNESLFYFPHGAPTPPPAPAWRAPLDAPPPYAAARDYIEEPAAGVGGGAYGSIGSVWGGGGGAGGAGWGWGVRPPPGFGAAPRPVRPYDPFRSLASIWAPAGGAALDWRPRTSASASPPPPPDGDSPH